MRVYVCVCVLACVRCGRKYESVSSFACVCPALATGLYVNVCVSVCVCSSCHLRAPQMFVWVVYVCVGVCGWVAGWVGGCALWQVN